MGMIMHDDVPYGEGTSYTQGTGIAINNNVIAVDADNTPTSGSEKPVKSKGVYSALESNRDESTSLLKSTVGWTGKNKFSDILLGYRLFGNESEGYGIVSITNGYVAIGKVEKNKNYIVSKKSGSGNRFTVALFKDYPTTTASAGRSTQLVADTSLNTYSFNSGDYEYVVLEANRTDAYSDIEPMLRDASITDDTYEPYHESVEEEIEQIYADNGVLGAKNLLNHKRSGSTTIQGITYTVNADLSISTSGTADANNNSWWNLLPNGITLPAGKYIISDNGNLNTPSHRLSIRLTDNTYVALGTSSETEVTLTATNQIVEFSIGIAKGQASNNYVFKPMLRLASDPDDTYVPYAMTNRELTEVVTPDKTAFTDTKGTTSVNTIVKTGNIVVADLRTNGLTTAAWESIATIPAGYRPANNVWFVANDMTGGTLIRCALNSDGKVTCPSAISNKEIYIHAFWSIV